MIKKCIIGLGLVIAFGVNADKFVIVVDKNHNKYEVKESYDEITYGEWSELSSSCTYDIMDNTVYFNKSFAQEETCDITQERSLFTKTIFPDTSFTTVETKEEKITQEINTISSQGTYLASSCLNAYNFDSTLVDGLYSLNISGQQEIMYCDMNRGGFTLVSHIYDRDNRDDILNNSNGSGWGILTNTPSSDTSFNLANSRTPTFTEAEFEWIFPSYSETFRHDAMSQNLAAERFAWVNPNPSSSYHKWNLITDLGVINEEGAIYGAFGWHGAPHNHGHYLSFLGSNASCGGGNFNNNTLHYWGFGSLIAFGSDSTYELHNVISPSDRANGDVSSNGCGTKNSILNIWVK